VMSRSGDNRSETSFLSDTTVVPVTGIARCVWALQLLSLSSWRAHKSASDGTIRSGSATVGPEDAVKAVCFLLYCAASPLRGDFTAADCGWWGKLDVDDTDGRLSLDFNWPLKAADRFSGTETMPSGTTSHETADAPFQTGTRNEITGLQDIIENNKRLGEAKQFTRADTECVAPNATCLTQARLFRRFQTRDTLPCMDLLLYFRSEHCRSV